MGPKIGFYPNIFVMTFSVNGIKQLKNVSHTVEVVIDSPDEKFVRSFLESYGILILSIKPYTEALATFGDVVLTIQHQQQDITIATKYTDPQKACEFFFIVGWDIRKISRYSTTINESQSAEIIAQAKQESEATQHVMEAEKKAKEEEEKHIYADEHLASAKKIILQVFEKVDRTLQRSEDIIS